MKVTLQVSRSGVGFSQNRGDVIDVDAAEAKRMIEAGQAVPVRSVSKPETATPKRRAEKATK